MEMGQQRIDEVHDCVIKLRPNPQRRKEKVYVGCGAGFGGDRPLAALKLLKSVRELDYLVLECLAERTLADRYQALLAGGDGYDSRISEWMSLLLPLAVERGVCIITNMGAVDPIGAREKVLEVASGLGLHLSVAVAQEVSFQQLGSGSLPNKFTFTEGGISTYLGAAPVVECLERYQPNVVITSRVADAALFLAPVVYELGWNWNDFNLLAQGTLAGHLLECGCQLTGGYFMHPGDKHRNFSFQDLLDLSLPYTEVCSDGKVYVLKAEGSAGVLNFSTCAQQLLYEVADPSAYVTPDVIIDIRDVFFLPLSSHKVLCFGAKPSCLLVPNELLQLVPKECGWKGWGEISYGGHECVRRAQAAEFLVISWMEEIYSGVSACMVSSIIGLDSLKASIPNEDPMVSRAIRDIRLHMDGLFQHKEHAVQLGKEITALYTNGPAGGGGISTGYKREIVLEKKLVERKQIFWRTHIKCTELVGSRSKENAADVLEASILEKPLSSLLAQVTEGSPSLECSPIEIGLSPAPAGRKIPLYNVAHSRTGDKGNSLNFSIIPHFPADIERLKLVITPQWVKGVLSVLLRTSPFPDANAVVERDRFIDEHFKLQIFEVKGIQSLNVVVQNILDGGVNCSRRIDRHGKTISDLILCQDVVLPP